MESIEERLRLIEMRLAFIEAKIGARIPTGLEPADPTDDGDSDLEIVDTSFRIVESNEVWDKVAWIVKLRSKTSVPLRVRVYVELLDADEFRIEDDCVEDVIIQPNRNETVRGNALVDPTASSRVKKVATSVTYNAV